MGTEMLETNKLNGIVKAYKSLVFFRLFPFPLMSNLSVLADNRKCYLYAPISGK